MSGLADGVDVCHRVHSNLDCCLHLASRGAGAKIVAALVNHSFFLLWAENKEGKTPIEIA
jgi:hypothetical protein